MLSTGIFRNHWWMVFGATIALMMNTGVVSNFAFAVFIKPITEDPHISRAELTGATLIAAILALLPLGPYRYAHGRDTAIEAEPAMAGAAE